MTSKIKTILFASLIAAMILPFSGMQFAEAKQDESSYEKNIKNTKDYKNLDAKSKAQFDKNLKESLEKASPYQKKVNKLLDNLATIDFEIEEAVANGEDTNKLEKKFYKSLFNLEKYGVVSEDRLIQNPEYWGDRAVEAMNQIAKGEEVSVSLEVTTEPEISFVHTDDVSLKNQSQMSYVCGTYSWFNIPIYCMNIDVEWGGGSDSYAAQYIAYSGFLYTLNKICLEDDGGHNNVFFTFDTEHYAKNIYGSTIWSEDNGPASVSLWLEGTCAQYEEDNNFINAGYYGYAETHLDTTITVN